MAQFYFLHRVRQALELRHPGVWRGMSKSWMPFGALHDFAWGRKDEFLGDADLSRKTKQLKLLYLIGYSAAAVFVSLNIFGNA